MRIVRSQTRCDRRGMVLYAVLVMLSLLSLAAYQFSELMSQEYVAAQTGMRATQARALADSGVYTAIALLSDSSSLSGTLNNNPYDNESNFHGVEVKNADERRTGRYSIVSAIDKDDLSGGQTFRYGVIDESGKINLNSLILKSGASKTVIHAILMKLPNMTDEIADAIIDWIDADDDPQPNGAESQYYLGLQPPYRCKNGPLDSIEELLLVRGVTPPLLFGTDRNRNGVQDSGEDDGSGWDPGWAAYLTVYSRSLNVDADGNARLFLNDTISQTYYQNLTTTVGQSLADFIVLASQNNLTGDSADYSKSDAEIIQNVIQSVIKKSSKATFSSVWDLLDMSANGKGKSVTITVDPPQQEGGQGGRGGGGRTQNQRPRTVTVKNPLSDQGQQQQLLPTLLDKTTTKNAQELPPRINVLTAPKTVLTCLTGLGTGSGLSDADVQSIISIRPAMTSGPPTDDMYKTSAWLFLEAKLPVSTMKAIENYVTSRTQVYRIQSIGYFDGGGPVARVEAVVDTNNGKPRILMWRDLTELGKGYNLDQ